MLYFSKAAVIRGTLKTLLVREGTVLFYPIYSTTWQHMKGTHCSTSSGPLKTYVAWPKKLWPNATVKRKNDKYITSENHSFPRFWLTNNAYLQIILRTLARKNWTHLKLIQLSLFKVICSVPNWNFVRFAFVAIERQVHISIGTRTSHVTCPNPDIPHRF